MTASTPIRLDGRTPADLRPITIERGFSKKAAGSALISAGGTRVLCTASIDDRLPPWMKTEDGKGWITAEYNMLPSSTAPRKQRERSGKVDGRTTEIQRLIGRSLRAVADLQALGPKSLTVDCDVIDADGGTRTLSITGALIATVDALASVSEGFAADAYPLTDSIAAISVGIVDGRVMTDLDYPEDFAAEVDMNVVMTGRGRFVELQGTGEEATFDEAQLSELVGSAKSAIQRLTQLQKEALGDAWPF
jgi:ribonuclease PH